MLRICNYKFENGNRCNSNFNLINLQFRDPNSTSIIPSVDLCKYHYDEITGQLNERVREFQMKLSNKITEQARLTRLAREQGNYYKNDAIQLKIEDLRALIKKITNNECRNFFCFKNLKQLDPREKLYSVSTFLSNGRRHYTFYFCSLKCFNIMKARCGLQTFYGYGQTHLNII